MARRLLVARRVALFVAQLGRCHYCNVDMWEGSLETRGEAVRRLGLSDTPSMRRAISRRRCTLEHLARRADGGTDAPENTVAACARCNSRRGEASPAEWAATCVANLATHGEPERRDSPPTWRRVAETLGLWMVAEPLRTDAAVSFSAETPSDCSDAGDLATNEVTTMMLNTPLPSDPGALLNTQQAANRLSLTVHALERWRVKGGGPPYAKLGSAVRYRVADLDAWIAANTGRSTSEFETR